MPPAMPPEMRETRGGVGRISFWRERDGCEMSGERILYFGVSYLHLRSFFLASMLFSYLGTNGPFYDKS